MKWMEKKFSPRALPGISLAPVIGGRMSTAMKVLSDKLEQENYLSGKVREVWITMTNLFLIFFSPQQH